MSFLHEEGELLVLDTAFSGRTIQVGLFNDSTDGLTDGSTYADITTEPSGTDYTTQSVSDPSVTQNSGTTEVDAGNLSFNVSDATESIDYVFVRDDASGDLIFTNQLDQSYDLSSIDTLDLTNVAMELE